jgi:hypothetical protein
MQDEYFRIVDDVGSLSNILTEKYQGKKFITISKETQELLLQEFKEKNKKLFYDYTGKDNITLFEDYESGEGAVSSQVSLDADAQHFIINNMKSSVRKILENIIIPVRNRQESMPFLYAPPISEVKRLNEVIMRQRFELRKLYENTSYSKKVFNKILKQTG